jgi:CheY-specific phosphatase CheX
MVREMRKNGTLNKHVQSASRSAADQVASLMRAGMQKHEAEEMVLPALILLKPEPGVE